MKKTLLLCVIGTAICAMACGQAPTTAPANAPATGPATSTAPADDARALEILKLLEQAGDKYESLQAGIEQTYENLGTGENERRTCDPISKITKLPGVAYMKGTDTTPARFRIQFDTYQDLGPPAGPAIEENVVYAFDGMWLSVLKYKIKNMTKYQVAAPGAKVAPMQLGKGPFPLPFGQKVADVQKLFAIKSDAAKDDKKFGTYLKLIPLKGKEKEVKFAVLEMWVDEKTGLPIKLISYQNNDQGKLVSVTTVVFKDIKASEKLDPAIFAPAKPDPKWELNIEPLEKK